MEDGLISNENTQYNYKLRKKYEWFEDIKKLHENIINNYRVIKENL